jgi:hypothetical protein
MTLKASYSEIEKRCVKHQKSEIEAKRQLTVYQDFIVSFYFQLIQILIVFSLE